MGIFSGLMGNASQKDSQKVKEDLDNILLSEENVEMAFALVRDLIVFTDYRLILVDKQGMTGKKYLINLFHTALFHALRLRRVGILTWMRN